MNVYGYTRAASPHEQDLQIEAIKLTCKLHGIEVTKGGYKQEIGSREGDTVIRELLKVAKPGDAVVTARPSVIHPSPLTLISLASEFTAKGITLLVCDQPGAKLDLHALRSLIEPMTVMQKTIDELKQEIQEKEAEHQKEFSNYQAELEKQIATYLADRGITLAHLLKPKGDIEGGSPVPRLDEGRKVRELREKLHLNQSEAGALVTPPLDKAAVSRIESQGSAAPRFAELRDALTIEEVLKNEETKKRNRGVNPHGAAPEHPRVAQIKDAVLGKLTDGLSQIEKEWADAQAAASKIAT